LLIFNNKLISRCFKAERSISFYPCSRK